MGLINQLLKNKKEEESKSAASVSKKGGQAQSASKNDKQTAKKAVSKKQSSAKKDGAESGKKKKVVSEIAHKIIIRPLVTEKTAGMESDNKYTFAVAKNADKFQIKKSVKDMYGVTPKAVNVVNIEGRRLRFRGLKGKRSDYKKAVVTLPKGKTIVVHKGV